MILKVIPVTFILYEVMLDLSSPLLKIVYSVSKKNATTFFRDYVEENIQLNIEVSTTIWIIPYQINQWLNLYLFKLVLFWHRVSVSRLDKEYKNSFFYIISY